MIIRRSFQGLALATAFGILSFVTAPSVLASPNVEAHISRALSAADLPGGATVRAVSLRDGALTVEFSPETANGMTDARLEALTDAVRAATADVDDIREYALTASGRSLAAALPPAPFVAPQPRPAYDPGFAPSGGALSGKVIVISPGHGWAYYGTTPRWSLQRVYYYGIVEDFVNQELIQNVYNLLVNNGATVYVTREMDKTVGNNNVVYTFGGVTRPAPNKPWWQMAAMYYAHRLGAPASVYDNGRSDDYNRDIAARPLYANWRNADIMVSLHNNGGGGTGTETLYDTGNGQTIKDAANQIGSKYLAEKLQARVINNLRSYYNSSWGNRGPKGFDGSYGENRLATRPAALIEVAFMDKETPDSVALRDENWKMLVAKSVYEGICDYFKVTPTYNTDIAAPSGTWTAQAWNRLAAFQLTGPVNAPPSSAGGWVYTATDAGVVHGITATPESGLSVGMRWRYPTSSSFGAPIKARPTVYGDGLYVVSMNGNLVELDRFTGQRRWLARVPNSGSLTAPPAVTADGYVVVGSDNGFIYSYHRENGSPAGVSPVAFGPIRAQVSIPDSGHVWVTSEDGRVRCLSGDLKTILWETDTGAPVRTAPFVLTSNNAVYFTDSANTIYGLNASNGSPALGWTANGARYGASITTSPWADPASGMVAFGTANHMLLASYLNTPVMPSDFPLRPAGVKEFTSDPVVLDGVIFVGGADGRLYSLQRTSGATAPGAGWRVFDVSRENLPGPFNVAPALTGTGPNDMVAAGNQNGYLYLLPLR